MGKKNIFITGFPGVGKTTVIRKVIDQLPSGISCDGFFTGEIRVSGTRVGFEICSLDGRKGVLAHKDLRTRHRVGKYGVDVAGFESLVLPLLSSRGVQLYVIDEIGSMECFSRQFCHKVITLLDSDIPVFGSIALKGRGFIQDVKSRTDVEIIEVTRSNRNDLVVSLTKKIQDRLR
jgi:nucleoside-triphosphatase THEP1